MPKYPYLGQLCVQNHRIMSQGVTVSELTLLPRLAVRSKKQNHVAEGNCSLHREISLCGSVVPSRTQGSVAKSIQLPLILCSASFLLQNILDRTKNGTRDRVCKRYPFCEALETTSRRGYLFIASKELIEWLGCALENTKQCCKEHQFIICDPPVVYCRTSRTERNERRIENQHS